MSARTQASRRHRSPLRRFAATTLLTIGYGFALGICALFRTRARGGPLDAQTILAIGTFHNPNWFYAHIEPLARSGVGEVILIADGHVGEVPGVTVLSPPPLMARLLTRAGAKFLFSFVTAIRHRPTLYVGYAIFPAATSALVLGRLFGGHTCFQLTSGPLELAGGGFHAENRVLASLGTPSPWIEKLAHALTRRFDLMIVRGSQAGDYVRALGFSGQIETITGSIEIPAEVPLPENRSNDLIFVGRFTERKRPRRFVELVRLVAAQFPDVRAVMVGDGPDLEQIRAEVAAGDTDRAIELAGLRPDVEQLLLQARIFVLTSRWEGVSIAMMEAMAAGCVPVVNDVGDLADMVRTGENGFLVDDDDIEMAATHIRALLADPELLALLSANARATVISRSSRQAIARNWTAALERLFN